MSPIYVPQTADVLSTWGHGRARSLRSKQLETMLIFGHLIRFTACLHMGRCLWKNRSVFYKLCFISNNSSIYKLTWVTYNADVMIYQLRNYCSFPTKSEIADRSHQFSILVPEVTEFEFELNLNLWYRIPLSVTSRTKMINSAQIQRSQLGIWLYTSATWCRWGLLFNVR